MTSRFQTSLVLISLATPLASNQFAPGTNSSPHEEPITRQTSSNSSALPGSTAADPGMRSQPSSPTDLPTYLSPTTPPPCDDLKGSTMGTRARTWTVATEPVEHSTLSSDFRGAVTEGFYSPDVFQAACIANLPYRDIPVRSVDLGVI